MARHFTASGSTYLDSNSYPSELAALPISFAISIRLATTGTARSIVHFYSVYSTYIHLYVTSGNVLTLKINGAAAVTISTATLTAGVWYRFVYSNISDASHKCYVNGTEYSSSSSYGSINGFTFLRIGFNGSSLAGFSHFDGELAYFGAWSTSLGVNSGTALSNWAHPMHIAWAYLVYCLPITGLVTDIDQKAHLLFNLSGTDSYTDCQPPMLPFLYNRNTYYYNFNQYITLTSIGTSFAINSFSISQTLYMIGKISELAISQFKIDMNIILSNIASSLSIGSHSLNMAMSMGGIASQLAVNSLIVSRGTVNINLTPITRITYIGDLVISAGNSPISVNSILSTMAIGVASKIGMNVKFISSIVRNTLYGTHRIIPGAVGISLAGKASNMTINSPTMMINNRNISFSSRNSSLAFGNSRIKGLNEILITDSINSLLSINEFEVNAYNRVYINPILSQLYVNSFRLFQARNIILYSIIRALSIGLCQIKPASKNIVISSKISSLSINAFTLTRKNSISLIGINSSLQIQSINLKAKNTFSVESITRTIYFGDIISRRTLKINSVTTNLYFGSIIIIPGTSDIILHSAISNLYINNIILRKKLVVALYSISSSFTIGNHVIQFESTTNFLNQIDKDWTQITQNNEFFIDGIFISNRWAKTQNIKVLFDDNYESVNAFQPILGMTNPRVTCMDKFQYKPVKNDKIIINGVNYTINSYEPDGTGIAVIQLQNEKTN